MLRHKLIRAETKVEDADKGTVRAVVSTEAKDRDGDIIRQADWNRENFLKHPVLVSSHNYGRLTAQIGEWEDMDVRGGVLEGLARYYIGEGNDEADWGFKLAAKGRAAFSVGFIPDMEKAEKLGDGKGWEFKGQELLEVSQVTIPSNPEALQRLKGVEMHPVLAELVDEALVEDTTALQTVDKDAILAELRAYLDERLERFDQDLIDIYNRILALQPQATPAPKFDVNETVKQAIAEVLGNA